MPRPRTRDYLYEAGGWGIAPGNARSPNLYRWGYNAATGRYDAVSLGTSDLGDAKRRLLDWLRDQVAPPPSDPNRVPLDDVLRHYYLLKCKTKRRQNAARLELQFWSEFWGAAALVTDLTPDRVREFTAWLERQETKPPGKARHHTPAPIAQGYVEKVLGTGRAALKFAAAERRIAYAPIIPGVETFEDKRLKEPMGRPITTVEAARILDAAGEMEEHVWRVCVLLICTMARPDAVRDLHSGMVNLEGGFINLLPPGRRQTKKRRPIIPICDALRPWLEEWGPGHYVTYHGKRIAEFGSAYRALRARVWPADLSALPPLDTLPRQDRAREKKRRATMCAPEARDVSGYSWRHTLGRYLRRQRVPGEEISLMLGHKIADESDTTGIYSPWDPDYCVNAKEALDRFCREVTALQKGPRKLVKDLPRVRLVPPSTGSQKGHSRKSSQNRVG